MILFSILLTMVTAIAGNQNETVDSIQRIVGGKRASIVKFSFMACIVLKPPHSTRPMFSGGASIISSNWAVTAAHCVYDIKDAITISKEVFIRSNTSVWHSETEGSQDHLIIQSIVHEDYNPHIDDNDIALLRVKEAFDGVYEKRISVAPNNYKNKEKSIVTALGWGTTIRGNVMPYTVSHLRRVNVNVVSSNACYDIYKQRKMVITPRMLCAIAPNKDSCINDSGGPLVQYNKRNKKTILVGIVSWGVECASPVFPGVYTKVSEFDKWIKNRIYHYNQSSIFKIRGYATEKN